MNAWIILWIVLGVLTSIWTSLDFVTNTTIMDEGGRWCYVKLIVLSIFFLVADFLLWPLYIIAKLLEWFWDMRRGL